MSIEEQEALKNGLKVIKKYTAYDYGPLSFYEEQNRRSSLKVVNNFSGGTYFLVTPQPNKLITLNRYFGGNANQNGQYWFLGDQGPNMALQYDLALHPKWNNTMQKKVSIQVPNGMMLFFGRCSPQSQFGGGGYQVFIPFDYLEPFLAKDIEKTNEMKNLFFKNYANELDSKTKRFLEEIQSQANINKLINSGNSLYNVPSNVRQMLKLSGTQSSNEKITTGSYTIHTETFHLPNGNDLKLTLSVTIEYLGATTRTYKQDRSTTVNETTHHYKKIFQWS